MCSSYGDGGTCKRLSTALAVGLWCVAQSPCPALGAFRRVGRPPLSQTTPGSLFHAIGRSGEFVPTKTFAYQGGPLPTNAWWENFATAEDVESAEGSIFMMPYVVTTNERGIHVIQPVVDHTEHQDINYQRQAGMSMGIIGSESASGPYVADWDELSFTIGWRGGEKGWKMQVPLVRGSPYVTTEYNGVAPKISSLQQLRVHNGQHWISVDGVHRPCDGLTPIQGRVFAIDVMEHDKTWLLLAPTRNGEGSSLEWICQPRPFSLVASQRLTGAVRLALVNDCTTGVHPARCQGAPNGKDASEYAELLVKHGGSYPTNGKVDFSVDGDKGVMTWSWRIAQIEGFQKTEIVQLAYPVHKPLLHPEGTDPEHEVHEATPFKDVRGPTVAVVGDVWDLHYDLMPEDMGLGAFRELDESFRQKIIDVIAGPSSGLWSSGSPEKDFDLPQDFQMGVGDTYFSGKQLGRMAQIIAVAGEVGQSGEPWFREMVDRLATRMEKWLDRDAPTPFLYDVSWGGVVSCGCEADLGIGMSVPKCKVGRHGSDPQSCPALTDERNNFGNSVYNDHHFHYGYWVYAASVLAKYKPAWEERWREQILALVRDYANPTELDHSFPVVRHKDWFLGFSWAGGISSADERGRNQESASEAVNAYYAVYTYGKMLEGKVPWARDLKDLGRIWTAMEAHGAETYWQVRAESEVYDAAEFPDHVIGILWSNSAGTEKTWFSTHAYAKSGIQLLPFTPASELYLKADWVNQHFQEFERDCRMDAECANGWSWTVCLEQAVIDRQAALDCIHRLPEDYFSPDSRASGGNSLSNALYWIGTRDKWSSSRVKRTEMPRASPLPPLPGPEDESQFSTMRGHGGGVLNSGITSGLATHGMINRFTDHTPVATRGTPMNMAFMVLAMSGFALVGAVIGAFRSHATSHKSESSERAVAVMTAA